MGVFLVENSAECCPVTAAGFWLDNRQLLTRTIDKVDSWIGNRESPRHREQTKGGVCSRSAGKNQSGQHSVGEEAAGSGGGQHATTS